MMSNSMFKKTAIAALLTSAPFASTDSTVSALRLRAPVTPGVTPGVRVIRSMHTVHRNPTQHPVPQDQLDSALGGVSSPVGNTMSRADGQVADQLQNPPRKRKEGCCHNTCNALDDCCMHDACFNLWLFRHLRRQGAFRNPAPAAPPGEQQMSRDEDGCTGCGTVQCPSNAGDCNCCCPCETAGQFIAPVCRDVGLGCNELLVKPVTECSCPNADFFLCTLPERCPVQCPTEVPQVQCPTEFPQVQCPTEFPQCPTGLSMERCSTGLSMERCPTDFCRIPDIECGEAASQCGTGATQCLGKCAEGGAACLQCPVKTCGGISKCCEGCECGECPCPSF